MVWDVLDCRIGNRCSGKWDCISIGNCCSVRWDMRRVIRVVYIVTLLCPLSNFPAGLANHFISHLTFWPFKTDSVV